MSLERQLFLLGHGPRLGELAVLLYGAGFWVTLVPAAGEPPRPADGQGVTLLAAVDQLTDLEGWAARAQALGRPWLVLCGSAAGAELTTAAYRLGALAVLPAESPLPLVRQALERAQASLRPAADRALAEKRSRRKYRAGDPIPLAENELLQVIDGVVAQFALHEDGVESLLGLWGKQQILSGHPEDACCLSLRAHTAVEVEVGRFSELSRRREVVESLWQRLLRLEAWSSMQSRQNIELRLLGILSLLAEQFGRPHESGTLVDVKVTHAQLAAAIGATRATVTRVLGVLRRRGALGVVSGPRGERFCLAGRQPLGHAHGRSHSHAHGGHLPRPARRA